MTPFGVEWNDVTRDVVLGFLEQREDESLTFEAKGGDITRHHVREAASAFGNSELGGVLLLGASQDRDSRAWTLDNWRPPEPEVERWISDCLDNGGVTPRPPMAVKVWDVEGGGRLACVSFQPVGVPPAMTLAGQVWERTSSKSVKVSDPTELRRLFERGRAAESRVHLLSYEGCGELYAGAIALRPHAAVIGFGATGITSENGPNVFRQSFARWASDQVMDLHRAFVAVNLREFIRATLDINQGGFTVRTNDGFDAGDSYSLRVGRDGRVAIGFSSPEMDYGTAWSRTSHEALGMMWATAQDVLLRLGGLGRMHAAAQFDGPNGAISAAQWADMESDGREEVARIVRDVQRAGGRLDWEPE